MKGLWCVLGMSVAVLTAYGLPPGFTKLDYIESTGKQYVDTGVTLDAFFIVRDGKAVASVEFGDMPSSAAATSAAADVALFNKYLKSVTGATLPTDGTGSYKVHIDLDPITNLTSRFDWKIDFPTANRLEIRATTSSLFAALRNLLERGCDARFLGVENSMFQYEPRKNVYWASLRPMRSAAHNFSLHRGLTYLPGHARELGFDVDSLFEYSHGLATYAFPCDRYDAEGWPTEILPVQNGERLKRPPSRVNGWQPCFSNPSTAAIAVTNILSYLRAHPTVLSITLGVNDNGGYCECDACKAMDANAEKSVFSNAGANRSVSYYTFVNRVAEGVASEFPAVRFGLLAYMGTSMPPAFNLHSNVVPVITCDLLAAGMSETTLSNQNNLIVRWGQKVPEIGIWDYCWGRRYCLPRVHFENQAARMRLLYEQGGRSYFGENSTMADMLDGPKTYLASRLCEDADTDPEKVLGEWYERFAGKKAAGTLKGIYDRCRDYWLSSEMRKSPVFVGRSWVYLQPTDAQFYALQPGFTAGLVSDAKKVLSQAGTGGEKKRAEILLRHFELLDCIASFRGSAYVQASNGELASASQAAAMLNEFADRAPDLMAEWDEASAYFENSDFEDPQVYIRKSAVDLDLASHFAVMFGKAIAFYGDAAVEAAFARVAALDCLPDEAKGLLDVLVNGTGENLFSNPGFASGLSASTVVTELPHSIDSSFRLNGENTLKVLPGHASGGLVFVENLPCGNYLALSRLYTSVSGTSASMIAWRQFDGKDCDWETDVQTQLPAKSWRTFAAVRRFDDSVDGLDLGFRFAGFGADAACWIGNVRLVKVGDVPSVRTGSATGSGISARGAGTHATVGGETAVLCDKAAGYDFAHKIISVSRLLPEERLVFTVRATRPSGSTDGKLGVYVYVKEDGSWVQHRNILWNHQPPLGAYGEVDCSLTGAEWGKKRGDIMIMFFHMKGTGTVGVSGFRWKVTK